MENYEAYGSLPKMSEQHIAAFKEKMFKFWKLKSQISCRPSRLMNAKTIYLNDDPNVQTSLTIGIDPNQVFEIKSIIENKSEGSYLKMDDGDLRGFLLFLDRAERVFLQKDLGDEFKSWYSFNISKSHPCVYEFNLKGETMYIDEGTLRALCQVKLNIEWYLLCIRSDLSSFQRQFFKMMHFVCDGVLMCKNSDYFEHINSYYLFNELTRKCFRDGDSWKFVIEISTNFREWFLKSVPIYMEIMLLKESVRLHTFEAFHWPNDEICVKKLAQAGLYYTLESDQAACVFCDILIHKWEKDDVPIVEHYKFSPRCRFLVNSKRSLNEPDVLGVKSLEQILTTLPERGYDEVDSEVFL